MFKTLVVRGDQRGVVLAVVPGNLELDPKALARLSGDKRVEMVPLKEVQPLTGYIRGGVTTLACKKSYPVFADERIQTYPLVAVSAGMRGAQLILAPQDYLRATRATVGTHCPAAGGGMRAEATGRGAMPTLVVGTLRRTDFRSRPGGGWGGGGCHAHACRGHVT